MCTMPASSAAVQPAANTCWTWSSAGWSGLNRKLCIVPKCCSMVIQASSGRRVIPTLTINGDRIPTAEDGEFKFLGVPVRVCSSNEEARSSLQETLRKMLSATDATLLTHHQKLQLFIHGVCPRLSWPLLVETFPTSWLERVLQPMATKALKSWPGLARHSNSSVLFLSVKRGGGGGGLAFFVWGSQEAAGIKNGTTCPVT